VKETDIVVINLDGEEPTIKVNEQKAPVAPKPQTKFESVSEYIMHDHPDKFKVKMNPILFNQLKEKVRTLKKSQFFSEKHSGIANSLVSDRLKVIDKEHEQLRRQRRFFPKILEKNIEEKDREYELLLQ